VNIFGSASPWDKSPFAHRPNLGQSWKPPVCDPAIAPGDIVEANGGHIEKAVGTLWFFPDEETKAKIEAHTGEKLDDSIEARVNFCNPTPPFAPTLGGFFDPGTGYYVGIDLPDEWHCATGAVWDCEKTDGSDDTPPSAKVYSFEGDPPYWGEWGYVNADGEILDSGRVGPFDTIDEAFGAAAEAASEHGATALPGDGWAQVKDSEGKGVGPIT
jgi:hypothetical protein